MGTKRKKKKKVIRTEHELVPMRIPVLLLQLFAH